jgi:hypothetical protein
MEMGTEQTPDLLQRGIALEDLADNAQELIISVVEKKSGTFHQNTMYLPADSIEKSRDPVLG